MQDSVSSEPTIHHVFANRSNIGDWLSALGIQSLLTPVNVREHLCDHAFVNATLDELSAATKQDLIIIGGGGLFKEYFAGFWRGFASVASRVPFCIWGVGYCDLKARPSRAPDSLLEPIVRGSRLCVVRDSRTWDLLRRCGLPPPVPCPSMVALEEPRRAGWGVVHVVHPDLVPPPELEMMRTQVRDFARRTGRPCFEARHQIRPGSRRELAATLALYAKADLIVTSRLHGCVIGLAMGRKVLAVSADYKVDSFMQDAGLREWVCDLDDVRRVGERLACLPQQPTAREFVEHARRENRAVARMVRAMFLRSGLAEGEEGGEDH